MTTHAHQEHEDAEAAARYAERERLIDEAWERHNHGKAKSKGLVPIELIGRDEFDRRIEAELDREAIEQQQMEDWRRSQPCNT
jgi:hypothetical protein